MDAENTVVGKRYGDRTLQLQGISPVVLLGLAVTVIFVFTTTAVVWLSVSSRRQLHADVQSRATHDLAVTLARSTEVALTADDVAGLRRIVNETALEANLSLCRITLADGRVVADLDAGLITPGQLPKTWSGSAGLRDSVSGPTVRQEILVPGRGSAVLEMASTSQQAAGPELNVQNSEIIIVVAGLLAVLGVYRFVVGRLKPVRSIYQALTDMAGGQNSSEALQVSGDFGPQATAWNALLSEWGDLKQQAALASARGALAIQSGDSGELTHACDALPQGLILVDAELRIRYANGAAGVLLGVDRNKARSALLTDLVTEERIVEGARTAAGGPTHKRTIVELQRGETSGAGVLRVIVRPVRQSDHGAAMVIIEDITQQRVAEDSRKAFMAQAADELRTPLTNIRLCVDEALDEAEANATPPARQFGVINDESRRLERVVSDILSISEIEAGSFKLARNDVHLADLVGQLEAEYQPQARGANLVLAFDLPPKLPLIRGDRDKILLTLHNLIGNALKYTPAGGRVTVGVAVTERHVTVDISDTGIGIGDEDRPRIFERFYRARDERVDTVTGSGLGLSLARDVAQLHGGDITVQSEVNKGTTFTLTLPLLEEAA